MASKPRPKPPKGNGKNPKSGMNPASIKAGLKLAIQAEMENIRRQRGYDLMMLNKGLGVGDIKAFEKEWEKHFENSTPLRNKTAEIKKKEEKIKPQLTKLSVEYKPTTKKKK